MTSTDTTRPSRFHGGNTGSNPVGEPNLFNRLHGSPLFFAIYRKYTVSAGSYPPPCSAQPLVRAKSLGIGVERHPRRRVTQQFLHSFDIFTVSFEDRRKCMAKRMPRNFLGNSQLPGYGLDAPPHHGAEPYWLLSPFCAGPLASPWSSGPASLSGNPLFSLLSRQR